MPRESRTIDTPADATTGAHQNIGRTARVLSALAEADADGLRLTDVTRITNLSKTAAHRCLAGLTRYGLATFEPDAGRFFLGDQLFAWTTTARKRFELGERVQPHLRRLADRTEDTAYFCVRRGDEAICYGRAEGDYPIKSLELKVGDRRPLGIGSTGLAIMAFLEEADIERLVESQAQARTRFGIPDSALRQSIRKTRAAGYAVSEGSIVKGAIGIGVPLRNAQGVPVASLSIAATSERLASPRREEVVERLAAEAADMEKRYAPLLSRE